MGILLPLARADIAQGAEFIHPEGFATQARAFLRKENALLGERQQRQQQDPQPTAEQERQGGEKEVRDGERRGEAEKLYRE